MMEGRKMTSPYNYKEKKEDKKLSKRAIESEIAHLNRILNSMKLYKNDQQASFIKKQIKNLRGML